MINNRSLRINHFRLIVTLSECGSLSEAAKRMHTTQPALSKWLKELEESIGQPVFERHARGIAPNALGAMLTEHANRILNELERAQYNLNALIGGDTRTLKIGSSPAAAPTMVPSAITEYLAHYPEAKIQLQEGTMNSLIEKLENGELDLVIGRMDSFSPSPNLHCEELYTDRLAVVSRPGHPLAGKNNAEWSDLKQFEWVVWPANTPIRRLLDAGITKLGTLPPRYRIESSSQVANLWLLKFSNMLSVSSYSVAKHFVERGLYEIIDFRFPGDQGGVGMVWRANEPVNDANTDMMNCLRKIGKMSQSSSRSFGLD